LTVLSVDRAYRAEVNRRTAERQRAIAMQRALSMSAQAAVSAPPSFANAQSAAAYAVTVDASARGPETWSAAFTALQSLPVAVVRYEKGVSAGAFAPGERTFAVAAGNEVSLRDRTGREVWSKTLAHEIVALGWTPSGRVLLAAGAARQVTILRRDSSVIRSLAWPGTAVGTGVPARLVRAVYSPREDRGVIVSAEGLVFLDLSNFDVDVEAASIGEMTICGTSVAWSQPDGSVVVQGLVADRAPRRAHRHQSEVTKLACAASGASIVSVGADDEVLWTRGSRTSRLHLRGVRQIALNDTGNRLAARTSAVQQSGRLDLASGVDEALMFADDVEKPIWRRPATTFPSCLDFHGDHMLMANDQVELLRVDARSTSAPSFDRLAESEEIDHMVGLSTPGRVLTVTKNGKVQEIDFEAGTRRPLGRTTGWATRVLMSDDRESALLFSRVEGADTQDQREVAILVSTDVAPGPIYFQRTADTAALPGTLEVLGLAPGPGSSSEVCTTSLKRASLGRRVQFTGGYESIDLSADGEHMILYGQAGALLVSRVRAASLPMTGQETAPEFIGAGSGVLLRSESPALVRLPEMTHAPLPFETGNPGSIAVTSDLRFARVVIEHRLQLWRLSPPGDVVYDQQASQFWDAGFTPDDAYFLAAVKGGGLDIVPLKGPGGTRHVPLPVELGGVTTVAVSGHDVVVAAQNGVARVDIETGTTPLIDAPGRAYRVDLAPGRRGSVLGYPDDRVFVLDAQDRTVARLRLSGTLGATAFAADRSVVALGSHDGGVRLVDLITGRIAADIRTESGSISKLTFLSADDWLHVVGSTRSTVIPLDPHSSLCQRAVRSLTNAEWIDIGGSGEPPAVCR
jgi:hypothetical protein